MLITGFYGEVGSYLNVILFIQLSPCRQNNVMDIILVEDESQHKCHQKRTLSSDHFTKCAKT
jgi:hypothetical protein